MASLVFQAGDTFGKWTVLYRGQSQRKERPGKRASVLTRWMCRCICGTERLVYGYLLKSHGSKSCGCTKPAIRKQDAAFRQLLRSYTFSAKKRGYDFSLTETDADALFRGSCVYCGAHPSNTQKIRSGDTYIYNGIDRKDSNRGYTSDNCVTCCSMCNRMKSDFSETDFIQRCQLIAERCKNASSR